MGMRRAYQEVVIDNLPEWYKDYHRRLKPHSIWQHIAGRLGMDGRRRAIITNNTITAAYSEADRNRHALELEQARNTADARVNYRMQQAIQKVIDGGASPEAKVEAIKALTQD